MFKYRLVFVMSGMALLAVSCSRRSYPDQPDPRYPGNERYPQPRNDRDIVIYQDPNPGNLPPGQSKKIYGDRSARNHAPGHRKKIYGERSAKRYTPRMGQRGYPLIIIRTPDIIIGRWNDGAFYHRNADGLFYWQAPDGRFYLDQRYINDVQYDEEEYRSWSRVVQSGGYERRQEGYDNEDRDHKRRKQKGKHKGKKWDDD
jgi:hypothetical protein